MATPDNINTALRKRVYELTEKHGAAVTLAMIVAAIENMREAGYMDPPGTMPRAGNWSGPYTSLWGPIAEALGVDWIQH
jgi:hypothetical protein